MRYRIERRDGVAEKPAWWNVAGTAFHECVREWETEAASEVGTRTAGRTPDEQAERFAHHLAEQTAETQMNHLDHPMSTWRAASSGREDRVWWLDHGPEMVARYVQAQEGREYEILRLGAGEPEVALAMELGFMLRLPGLPPVKGFLDQALYFPATDEVRVRDLKSGRSTPADSFQLKVYRLALSHCFGIDAERWTGDYWNARKGEPTRAVGLSSAGPIEREVRYRLGVMDTAERAGLYPPNPTNLCGSCGVRAHCPAMSDEPFTTWGEDRLAVAPLSAGE